MHTTAMLSPNIPRHSLRLCSAHFPAPGSAGEVGLGTTGEPSHSKARFLKNRTGALPVVNTLRRQPFPPLRYYTCPALAVPRPQPLSRCCGSCGVLYSPPCLRTLRITARQVYLLVKTQNKLQRASPRPLRQEQEQPAHMVSEQR